MAFMVCTDKDGLHYVQLDSNVTDRWSHHTHHFDRWSEVPIGTRIVVTDVHRPKHLPAISTPRPDGLHEVVLVRMKVERYTLGYGLDKRQHEDLVPVFAVASDPKKRPSRAFGYFAFADDAGMVRSLVQHEARQRANTALANSFTSYANGCKAEREKLRVDDARRQREQRLEALAAEAGVSVDDLKDGIDAWNRIRRKRYPVNACLVCGRKLTDPASIVTGVGPECVKYLPKIKAAAKAKVLDVGRMRWDADRLVNRFQRAGVDEIAQAVSEAALMESLTSADK